ncbi:hypothetical protein NDU88_000659 [Pleurodeles waltl]|uniref:Uncharacterized protein n=1 Tax=Pleurodeles waltl TaxID=8319 RepID=A0AAV7V710_PLEWA|nr:hypothetical protein NDU88_000659 [Pleurodeles waltl]
MRALLVPPTVGQDKAGRVGDGGALTGATAARIQVAPKKEVWENPDSGCELQESEISGGSAVGQIEECLEEETVGPFEARPRRPLPIVL